MDGRVILMLELAGLGDSSGDLLIWYVISSTRIPFGKVCSEVVADLAE